MKGTIFATVFAIAIAAVSAQTIGLDLSQVPPCSVSCALTSIGDTKCQTSDFGCICADSNFITELAPCIKDSCTPEDQAKMVTLATALCSQYDVTIPSDILSPINGTTTNGTITTSPSSPASTTTAATTSTSSGAAARMAGSGFVAAAMGAALFVL